MGLDDLKKKTSRDAARQRRGQQNDEYGELSQQLPLPPTMVEKMDRLCVMRLTNSYIKVKHVVQEIKEDDRRRYLCKRPHPTEDDMFNKFLQKALGGFVFVLAEDGQCLYISPNVSEFLGLQQLELMGHSIYKYVHPCDQENLAKQLGGRVPLADMEIFDGLFCSDVHSPPVKQLTEQMGNAETRRSFCLRMKSTLTSRGKSVNMNASIHRVVHCTGTMKMCRMRQGISNGSITRCLLGVGIPLLCSTSFEVPLDSRTFISKHNLDFTVIGIDEIACDILGYSMSALKEKSWYNFCNVCDISVLQECHQTVLKQGQSVSSYYRIMVKDGGWVWMQTKANMVYNSTTHLPAYTVCAHYVISTVEASQHVLSLVQAPPTTLLVVRPPGNKRRRDDGKPPRSDRPPPKDHRIASILPHKVKQEPKTTSIHPTYIRSRILYPAPIIPYPLHDMEINLSSLDDPSPQPSLVLPGPGDVGPESPASGVSVSAASPPLPTLQVVNALKQVVAMDAMEVADPEDAVAGEIERSPAATAALLNFDDEFPLAALCETYKELDFAVGSPSFSTASETSELHELDSANAHVSSLFLLQEDGIVENDASWAQGLLLSEGEEDEEEKE